MSARSMEEKKVLVTGGASGIGLACVKAFAEKGATVIVCDINEDNAQRVANEVGGEVWAVDLADTLSLDNVSLDIDVLISNAGVQKVAPIEEFDPDYWRFMHRLMVEAPFLLTRAALPGMYKRGFGRIIHISSIHGHCASPYKSAYVTAKHAIEGLSKVTALEGGEKGVTSNCIAPAYVRTPLMEEQIADQARRHGIDENRVINDIMLSESAIKKMVEPEQVAQMALWLASAHADMVTGSSFSMDGGWTAK